jgi:hypothetical protein
MDAEQDKQAWAEPTIEPLTDAGSRADVQDVQVQNVVNPSNAAN